MKLNHKYRLLLKYIFKYKKYITGGGLTMISGVILIIPTPLLTMYLIDDVLPAANMKALIYICLLCVLILLIKAVCDNFQNYYFAKLNNFVIFDIEQDIIQSYQKTSTQYRHQKQTGYIMSRINDDPSQLHSLFANTLLNLLKDIITLIVGVIIIFNIHWKLAFVSIALLPVFVIFTNKFHHKLKKLSRIVIELNAQYKRKLQESISMIDTFFIFNALKYDTEKLIQKKKMYIQADIKKIITSNIGGSIISIIAGLAPILVICYGFFEIMNGRLTLGEFIAFNSFIGYVLGPTNRIVSTSLSMQQSIVAWDRVYEILTLHSNNKQNKIYRVSGGNIEFTNVSLLFDDKLILKDINLKIKKNTVIAIVGESGGGKSSLVSLLTGINKCNKGSIFLDDNNINEIVDLNDAIALVDQEPSMLAGTVIENITMGVNNIQFEEILKAAKIANIHEYIMSLPEQYNTVIDEKGKNMSIGQKQRLAITRCIVRKPKIFIMDEPTANLDLETEKNILESISPFIKSRTSIIISHRLTSITFVDEIIAIKNGTILEIGNHESLINKKGYYYNLWQQQHNSLTREPVGENCNI
jgi:subfamily B ATP-binding cassette protein MsbA